MKRGTSYDHSKQTVPFRLDVNDHKALKKLLIDDEMTFQKFVASCVEAYLRGDPNILKCVKDWKLINSIPPEDRDKYNLSQRERQNILDEIENASTMSDDKV